MADEDASASHGHDNGKLAEAALALSVIAWFGASVAGAVPALYFAFVALGHGFGDHDAGRKRSMLAVVVASLNLVATLVLAVTAVIVGGAYALLGAVVAVILGPMLMVFGSTPGYPFG